MSAFTGTGALVKVMLRRDRWLLVAWVVLLAGYPVLEVANASPGYDVLAESPGFLMLWGPLYGASVGALATWSSGDLLWVYGLVSALWVIRQTRAEEEAGRAELLGATALGRHAGLTAALIVAIGVNLALAAAAALGVIAQGLPAAGSIALGLRFAMIGCVFAAVGAIAAQLAASAAGARGIAVVALAATFLLRAAGDAGGPDAGAGWLAWLSPLGWAHRLRPFADERWWVLALLLAALILLVALALALAERRDVGTGALRPRPGPASAPAGLRTPLALAWRLQRWALVGWIAGFAVLGAVFGGAADGAGDLFREDQGAGDLFQRLGGAAAPSDVFLAAIMSVLGVIAAAYAVQATLRLRSEETELRAEPILATSVGRLRWAASHLVFALAGPALALAAAGLSAGLVYGLTVGDVPGELPRALAAALVELPAVWVVAGIALALVGLRPRIAKAGWVAWAATLAILVLGAQSRDLGDAVEEASPFGHLPKLPGAEASAAPLLSLAAIAALLIGLGLLALRRRDVAPG